MRIITWHGEGKTLFYIAQQLPSGEWECVTTFHDGASAEAYIKERGYCHCGDISYFDSVAGYCYTHHWEHNAKLNRKYWAERA